MRMTFRATMAYPIRMRFSYNPHLGKIARDFLSRALAGEFGCRSYPLSPVRRNQPAARHPNLYMLGPIMVHRK